MPVTAPRVDKRIEKLEKEIRKAKQQLVALRRRQPKRLVTDFTFKTWAGKNVTLSSLFDDRNELIVIHNMGKGCPYCTLWADGFNGIFKHMENRVPFVVISPDDYKAQRAFARGRKWQFRMFSSHGTSFFLDMGFATPENRPWPGVSIFVRDKKGKIYQTAHTYFGPGDDFCSVWPLLDILPKGAAGWEPKFKY
jgi:predicted dithiol-disulfide oxidoreductase (DUF899 family)